MTEIPDELIEIAFANYSMHGEGLVHNLLAAVLPAHEAMVRAKVAEEIGEFRKRGLVAAPYERCMLVARGEDPDGPGLDAELAERGRARIARGGETND